jgi:hypothetical protein
MHFEQELIVSVVVMNLKLRDFQANGAITTLLDGRSFLGENPTDLIRLKANKQSVHSHSHICFPPAFIYNNNLIT